MAEWLKAADCKSALARVRGFESLPTNKQGDATVVTFRNGEDKKPKHADGLAWPWTTIIE